MPHISACLLVSKKLYLGMGSPVSTAEVICGHCGVRVSATMRNCPTCQTDAGAPNVRACRTDENLKALTARFESARTLVSKKGCKTEFHTFSKLIETRSGVVVSMPATVAIRLTEDPNSLYVNYEKLVGAGIRKPADPDNDRRRSAVGGTLFGSYAKQIVYGVLSLTAEGLPSYGAVYCRLKSIAIEKRTSFLETNSYRFVRDHSVLAGDKIPVGYSTCWKQRHCLVLAKLAELLSIGQTQPDWQAILIQSGGIDRNKDEFVEAHIYEGFDRNAIKTMLKAPDKTLDRRLKLDQDLAISEFKKFCENTK